MATFDPPAIRASTEPHHEQAAAGNAAVADRAAAQLRAALSGTSDIDKILLKAAAGAGKSYVLKRLVAEALEHDRCLRVAVMAAQNRQLWPLAASLGKTLGQDRVCLFTADKWLGELPDDVTTQASVATSTTSIPITAQVVLATSHKFDAFGERGRLTNHLGEGANGESTFDVLFIDEAWQLPHHRFDRFRTFAPLIVGVGDVGQLPPLEIGTNPWRGDPGHNPYRAWPTAYLDQPGTWAEELPAVWRPIAEQLPLWRAFYPEWEELNCVAAPGDRAITTGQLPGLAETVWREVATGVPVLLEVDGLDDPEAPDVDLPLMTFVKELLDDLFAAGFTLTSTGYDDTGAPNGHLRKDKPGDHGDDRLVVILATRNQAVDDATDVVEHLRAKHGIDETDLHASTVDSWQGQTNGITVAVHPLSGASGLDEFNSAFGRLAVTCTRATHGLLVVTRPGLDDLLAHAPARPGTPFGEPGNRRLPRQTHQRILRTFARGRVTANGATADPISE
jgi:hypothetical protein